MPETTDLQQPTRLDRTAERKNPIVMFDQVISIGDKDKDYQSSQRLISRCKEIPNTEAYVALWRKNPAHELVKKGNAGYFGQFDRYLPEAITVFRKLGIVKSARRILELGGGGWGYEHFFRKQNYFNVDFHAQAGLSDKQLATNINSSGFWDTYKGKAGEQPEVIIAQHVFETDDLAYRFMVGVDYSTMFQEAWENLAIGGRFIVYNTTTAERGLIEFCQTTDLNKAKKTKYVFPDRVIDGSVLKNEIYVFEKLK